MSGQKSYTESMDIVVQIIINSLIAGSIYALVGLGFNLIFSTVKFFDLGYGALTAVGGYGVYAIAALAGLPTWLGVIVGVIVAGLVGLIVERLVYRKLREREASNMVLLVASLGMFTALQALIAILFSSQFRTLPTDFISSQTYQILGGTITQVQIVIFVTALLVMSGLAWMLYKTMYGKAVRAIADDREMAEILGVPTERIIGAVFFIGSAIAGLAGILVGFDTGIEPTMGFSLLLKGVVAAIIGGVGNPIGGVVGAFLLGGIENIGVWFIAGEWKDAIAFLVLIIILLVRPHGLFSQKDES
jgi:branched-chain amino acid transport system permease protein